MTDGGDGECVDGEGGSGAACCDRGGCSFAWCVTRHGREIHPDDEARHLSTGYALPLRVREGDDSGTAETIASEVVLFRAVEEDESWLIIAGQELEYRFDISVPSVHDLLRVFREDSELASEFHPDQHRRRRLEAGIESAAVAQEGQPTDIG